jgi:V/A-type H+-transporting ATPase subunit I
LEKTLQAAGFEREILPAVRGGTVDALSAADLREREQLEAKWQQGQRQLSVLAERFSGPLAELKWVAENESRLLAAGQQFARTESALLLSGWVPRAKVSQVEARLRAVTAGRCVIELTAARDVPAETIPVLLQHPRWLRPFERLVAAYGLPHYREIEPTVFVALSYVVMFGVMFGDVGHGAILVLGGLLVMRQSRSAGRRDAGRLVLSGGISSLFFGLLYGSFFGLPAGKRFALWHDPLEGDPLELLTGAIGLGVVMISLGLVLNVINRWRRGDFIGGVLGKFGLAGAVFYWGSLLLLTQYAAIDSRGLLVPAIIVFIALPVVAWTLKEPVEWLRNGRAGKAADPGGGLVAAFGESFVSAFEAALSFFANTISFVRLAAYAMSHAALLMAAFLLADAVKPVSPAGGGLAVLMVVLGNVVAILLEGVVASVQALRLEYYEFFGKFFGGGGQPFNPFRLQTPTVAEPPL